MMAAADQFDIVIDGRGGHGAHAYQAIDPIVIAAQLITALQSVVSRNVPGPEAAVLTVAAVHAGDLSARNVIPDQARLSGTVRTFSPEIQALVESRMRSIIDGMALSFGASISLDYTRLFPATINTPEHAAAVSEAAIELFGHNRLVPDLTPSMGSEDFSYMLSQRPGAYFRLGQGGAQAGRVLHSSRFDFNDDVIPAGAAMFARIVERRAPLR